MVDGLLRKAEANIQVGGFIADFLFTLGLIVSIGSVLISGGAYVYTLKLQSDAEGLKEEVKKLEGALEPQLLDQILGLDKKLRSIREVLASHVIPSNVFEFLEDRTLPQVQFTVLTYSADQRKAELSGQASSYATLAEQVRAFEAENEVEDVDFGGLAIGEKNLVGFKMTVTFTPAFSKFK